MSASIVINVGTEAQLHSNGLSGTWIVPPKQKGERFGMSVIYPTPEIQDIGDERRVVHWLKSRPLAMDIVGLRSDAAAHGTGQKGTKEKWGLLLCAEEIELPKELERAIEDEIILLGKNRPRTAPYKDPESGATCYENIFRPGVEEKLKSASDKVQELRAKFEDYCRSRVTEAEVKKAEGNLLFEDQRLVAEGDAMWAAGEGQRRNINELHKAACGRLGQERPWAYHPVQLVDCPGCGAKIKENILICPQCQGWLEPSIAELSAMDPKERLAHMYPERVAETVPADKPARKRA